MKNHALIMRWALSGPVTFIAAILGMGSMPLWVPEGAAGIDHLALSVISFPAWWGLAFFYTLLEQNLWRASIVMAIFIAANGTLIAMQFLGGG